MAARDDILMIFRFLGLPEPDGQRLERLTAEVESGARNIRDIRNDLMDYLANQRGVDPLEVVKEYVLREFERLGLAAPDDERLTRLANEVYGGSGDTNQDEGRTFEDIRSSLRPFAEAQQSGTVDIGGTVIPKGAQLVRVRDPQGSDAAELYYLVYEWNGVKLSYEIGDQERFDELFGSVDGFNNVITVSQGRYDSSGYVSAGSADQLYGSDESIESRIERDVRELGMEDLPGWLRGDQSALALVAEATAQGWSSGRLWQELSSTQGFQDRYGDVIGRYTEGGRTIEDAVAQIVADEDTLRSAIRRFQPAGVEISNEYLHQVMGQGWTASQAAAVLATAKDMRRNPEGYTRANQILQASVGTTLDEVAFINALQGTGAPEVIEALNTAQASRALAEAGLDDVDLDLLMSVVDTSDQLLTAESFRSTAQQLSFNLIRNFRELDLGKLGVTEDDLVSAAFGRESPTGRSAGETLNLLARLERDRQQADSDAGATAYQDDRGRLRVAGLSGL